jgi:hypothetical protein
VISEIPERGISPGSTRPPAAPGQHVTDLIILVQALQLCSGRAGRAASMPSEGRESKRKTTGSETTHSNVPPLHIAPLPRGSRSRDGEVMFEDRPLSSFERIAEADELQEIETVLGPRRLAQSAHTLVQSKAFAMRLRMRWLAA